MEVIKNMSINILGHQGGKVLKWEGACKDYTY